MFNLFITAFGKQPPIRVHRDPFDQLYPESLTLGTLYLGRQGSGKTSALARHLVEYFHRFNEGDHLSNMHYIAKVNKWGRCR